MESTESRFAHLLQPIRELTRNWDIDVASELNDYLEELDEMCITFDGGNVRLNFAEAALLIQGSACIYSKKVELLHSLVYQTLEYINDKNKRRNKPPSAAQGDDTDGAASGRDADDVAVFSPLDLDVSEDSQRMDASPTAAVTPLPPESLIPPEAREKNKAPLISVKGEILCSQKDFRINIFIPGDEDMILLMLGSAASRLLPDKHPADSPRRPDAAVGAGEDVGGDAPGDLLPVEDDDVEVEQVEECVDRRVRQAQSDGRMVRERRHLGDDDLRTTEATPPVNVWALHDPYAGLGEDQPLRAGKCSRVPEGLDDGGKRKRKRAAALQDFRTWFRAAFDPPEQKLKNGPTCTDLNYVYLSTMKDKLKTRKRTYRRAGVVVSDEELRETFLQPEEVGPQREGVEPVEGFRQDNLMGGDDDASDNEHEGLPDDGPAEFDGGPDFISPETRRDELSYEDLVKLRVEQLVLTSRGYTQQTALSQRVKDWEDKVRPELVLQEERPPFDIHHYGDQIVRALKGVGHRRRFSSIVAGLDNFESCKYLLASLQLANDGTVAVDSAEGLQESLDSMGLTLLSTQRATDRFKTLTASA